MTTRRLTPTERVTIAGPAGALEAVVDAPGAARPRALTVVCHPHPLHGGTLQNKVVHTLARALQELGAASLRFNFRGVGASGGSFGDGVGESDDAAAVIEWGARRWPHSSLWLGGFSFGGAVAIRAAASRRPSILVTVAPAVHRADLAGGALPDCPWLIVQGDADEVVPCRDVQRWAGERAPAAQLVILQGVGHFFHGRLHELKDAVTAFVARQEKSPGGP